MKLFLAFLSFVVFLFSFGYIKPTDTVLIKLPVYNEVGFIYLEEKEIDLIINYEDFLKVKGEYNKRYGDESGIEPEIEYFYYVAFLNENYAHYVHYSPSPMLDSYSDWNCYLVNDLNSNSNLFKLDLEESHLRYAVAYFKGTDPVPHDPCNPILGPGI